MSAEDRAATTDRLRRALLAFRAAQGLVLQAHRRLKGRPQAEADAFRDRPPGRSSGRSVPLLRADSAAAAAGL